jgi:uncharacterized integral membrane protein (TIGR00698 family)
MTELALSFASRGGVRPIARLVLPALALIVLFGNMSSGFALVTGAMVGLTLGNPWPGLSRALAHRALTWSVVGLGAGMNLGVVARVGLHGIGYTAIGIASALVMGTLIGRRLRVAPDTSLLITVGTAICGGSAIAAVAPAIGAKEHEVSISLVTVFLLNAIALFVFPVIGHYFHLGQNAFGLWCALAIHDTSSVVAAAAQYGPRALEVATAAKLARALWIVPVTFGIAIYRRRQRGADVPRGAGPRRPWFIAGFLGVAAIVTFVPALRDAGRLASGGAHRLLAVTLFLMGLGLSRPALRALGVRPLLQAIGLWLALGGMTFLAIVVGWI